MATSLAAQLSQIAANSTNTLNLKAQKVAHSKSLIFEPRVAASQNFDTLYTLCYEGYKELCLLDHRFTQFQRSLFSEDSREQDRTQITAAQNEDLDRRIEDFLSKVGSKLQISPAVKAVEWLIRRFRIHEYNTSFLLTTFLPYHCMPIFLTLLSILPKNVPSTFRFLHPYIRSLKAPPRRAIVLHIAYNIDFMTTFNNYMLRAARNHDDYPVLTAFWAGLSTEAVNMMMDKARSGRQGVQLENEQTIILGLLPTLNEGLSMKKSTDLRLGCYMLLALLATKGALDDKLISAMMEAVVLGWTKNTFVPGVVCLAILAQQRTAKKLPKRIARELMKVPDIEHILLAVSERRRIDKLANGFLLSLVDRFSKCGDHTALTIIQSVLSANLLTSNQAMVVLKSMLLLAHMHEDSTEGSVLLRTRLADFLTNLARESGAATTSLQKALAASEIDVDDLELKLNVTLRSTQLISESSADNVTSSVFDSGQTQLLTSEALLAELSTYEMDETSFLSQASSTTYERMRRNFLASLDNPILSTAFERAPVLRRNEAADDPRYFSFFMRILASSMPVLARAEALNIIARRLAEPSVPSVDFQALIPFCLYGLGDSAAKIRQAAANVLAVLLSNKASRGNETLIHTWGKDTIYGQGQGSQKLVWMSPENAQRFLHDVLGTSLEECVLDKEYIVHLIETTINSGNKNVEDSSHQPSTSAQLRQATRASILSFLTSHAINVPLYAFKLRFLSILSHVRGVASTTRTKLLLPLLQEWSELSNDAALHFAAEEHISVNDLDDAIVSIVSPTDLAGLEQLSKITTEDVGRRRRSLTEAAFRRFAKIWTSMKGVTQTSTARHFLRLVLFVEDCPDYVQDSATDLLKKVNLSTETLSEFITMLPTSPHVSNRMPTTKRRRTSHGEVATSSAQDPEELAQIVRQVTFVLQLVDSSDLRAHIPLLKNLFHVLNDLQRLKHQVASELGYLQGLVLSSLLSILDAIKSDKNLVLDRSSVRADLLVDCIQKTSSPQVQNAALLLIARLAVIAPDLVLHSVMPVFTFMGTSVLRQNDDYSAHVIRQTIDEVIPPLIESLRREKQNPVVGATELLLSFVAAYEHVPQHRRLDLFQSLVKVLGPDDFLFAVVAMLSDKYGASTDVKHFSSDLVGMFSVQCQLVAVVKYLELVTDALGAKPVLSTVLLGLNDSAARTQHHVVLNLLSILPHILSRTELVRPVGKILRKDDMQSSRVRELYSSSLETLLAIADTAKSDAPLHSACGEVLASLLGLLATDEFVKSVEGLLDKPDKALRRKILRSLEIRVDQEGQTNVTARQAMLGFLPQLTSIIRESDDDQYKHTAVSCIDKIAEKYGKKDLEAVAAAAQVIASDHCLGQSESRLRVAALLCLASLTEILREAIVPILPTALPMALDYTSLRHVNGSIDLAQHNAALSFISSLAQYLPYMLSGMYLKRLLTLSALSAAANLGAEANESRTGCLRLVAKQVDANVLFSVLEQSWTETVDAGVLALREYLDLLSLTIEKHSKSIVTRNSSMLSSIFLKAFDLKRYSSQLMKPFDDEDLEEAETKINAAAVKMIYKFNDQTFRPIFSKLIDWSASGVSRNDVKGRVLRMQSVYSFMSAFFGNLKSIVTSYAAYMLENAAESLLSVDVEDDDSKELWVRVLQTLNECFEHDQDEFWQSPSHFNTIATALDAQFGHAPSLPLEAKLVPAIVELAAAADSAEHHKELNTRILRHMRSERATVRLAAVMCEQALTDRLGEEWLSMLPEMLPFISELQEDDDEVVERETHRWIVKIEGVLGESLDAMLQ